MKRIAIIAGALAVLHLAHAQGQPNATVIASGSGQFFVSARGGVSPAPGAPAGGADFIRLDGTGEGHAA